MFGDVEFEQTSEDVSRVHYKNFQKKGHRVGAARGWNVREFIAWDGEGITFDDPPLIIGSSPKGDLALSSDGSPPKIFQGNPAQNYVLLANSKGDELINKDGCATIDCFEMFLDAAQRYERSIFVGFSLNYDFNQILKDLPERRLRLLWKNDTTTYKGYWIRWRPNRTFNIIHLKTKRSAIIYDVFGFFQKSFLETCKDYLGENHPSLEIIRGGKADRDQFEWEQMDDKIRPYCQLEVKMLVEIMNLVRERFHDINIDIDRWYGPGAVANRMFKMHKIPISREVPEEVLDVSQFAYAGGRFEQFYMGRWPDTVWEYDIHSAYPAATLQLPDISRGHWEFVKQFEPGTFGVWYIDYRANDRFISSPLGRDRPQPLFCRSGIGSISYPFEVQGWYWTPEAELVPDFVQKGYVFRPDTDIKPFGFVKEMYEQRRLFIREKNPTERSLKLGLNSIYGKLAQTIGAKNGPPTWHQLEYAGYITSYTRAQIFRAIELNPDKIIAVETDAVFSMVELDLPVSEELGEWELKHKYDDITYIQSGFYYGRENGKIIPRSRGMDRDRRNGNQPIGLSLDKVLKHLAQFTGSSTRPPRALHCESTRFVGLGLALMTSANWRSWEKRSKRIALHNTSNSSKRLHLIDECPKCTRGISMAETLHPLEIGGYTGESYARWIPWRTVRRGEEAPISQEEKLEMSTTELDYTNNVDRWQ